MKLKMFQVRFLYDNLNHRSLSEILLASRILECIEDDDKKATALTLVQNILSKFNQRVITQSLPCETVFFTQKDYKSVDLESDRKKYLKMNPQEKSIMTILDYEGFLGSPTLNYICRRLMYLPKKNDDKELELSFEVIVADANMLLNENYNEDTIESSLSKQIVEKQQMIQSLLDSQSMQSDAIVKHAETLNKELLAKRNELDVRYVTELNKFTAQVTDYLAKDEKKIRALLDTFKYDVEYGNIMKMLEKHGQKILAYVETIKSVSDESLAKIENKITDLDSYLESVKISEDSINKINALLSGIKFKVDAIKINAKTPDKHIESLEQISDSVEGLIKQSESIAIRLEKISPSLRSSIKHTQYFIQDSKVKIDKIEKDIEQNFGLAVESDKTEKLDESLYS